MEPNIPLNPPTFPSIYGIDINSGVPTLTPRDDLKTRHLRTLATLPPNDFLEDDSSPQPQDAVSEVGSSAAAKDLAAIDVPAVMHHLAAAHQKPPRAAVAILKGNKNIQLRARGSDGPVPPPPPPALSAHLKTRQLAAAADALERGAQSLRSRSDRAVRAHADALALRPHWKLLSLARSRDDKGHVLSIALAGAEGGDASAAPLMANASTTEPNNEVSLRSDESGALNLPPSSSAAAERLIIDGGFDDANGPRGTLPFLSADDGEAEEMEVEDAGGGSSSSVAPSVKRTHQRLLADQFSLDARAMFTQIAREAASAPKGQALLQAQANSVLLECPHVPALSPRCDGDGGQAGLRGVEIGALSRWHKAVMNVETKASAAGLSGATTTSTIPLLPFVMDALSLDSMQRRLRDGLDLIASVWREPRLVCHWVYGDDEDDAAEKPLHAMVDLTIELGGRVCAALSVMVCGGRVHAQYMGGGGAGGGGGEAEALQVFPMAAVRGVGAAEDGCAALIELVHAVGAGAAVESAAASGRGGAEGGTRGDGDAAQR